MPLRLTYLDCAAAPVEVEGITPDRLRSLTLAEIESLPIRHGSIQRPLAEFFRVQGRTGEDRIWWEGDLSNVHWLGAKMTGGRMVIEGHVGRHLGSQMRGGEIRVLGDASDWLGAEMRGGSIKLTGSAGHNLGAAYRGSRLGMRGGAIVVAGDAGNEVGHSMRRGMIAVGGAIGDLVGSHMRAGTIMSFGRCGIRHGSGMRRGTLAFLGERPETLPTFRRGGRHAPLVLRLLLRQLAQQGLAAANDASHEIDLFHGDLLEGGRGEIWLGGN